MEKAKSKKKLIAIIAGAAMAFVLTVVVSVAATLAYFGQAKDADTAVTMGGSVLVGASATEATSLADLIPGQKVNMDVKASVSSSTEQNACLLAILSVTSEDSDVDVTAFTSTVATSWTKVGTATGTLAGDVYMLGTSSAADVIAATTSATEKSLFAGSVTIPTTWGNEVADAEITIVVTFIATQTPVDAQGEPMTTDITYANLKPIAQSLLSEGTTLA